MRINPLIKENYLILCVILGAALARGLFITAIQVRFFDEGEFIPAAYSYIERGFIGTSTWYHPNLRSIIVYSSISLFGDNPVGWRLPWILTGISSIFFLYLLTRRITGSAKIATVASFLLAIDPLHISQTRINPDETMTVFTSVAGLYFALRYREELKPHLLILAGLMIGVGISVKWYTVFTTIIVLLISSSVFFQKEENLLQRGNRLVFIFLALTVLPATIYLLTYYAWFGKGYSPADFLWLQLDMYVKQQSLQMSDFEDMSKLKVISPYYWFILPSITGFRLGLPWAMVVIPFVSNPFVWLLALPSIGYVIFRCMVERSFLLFVIAGAFFIQYLPILFVSRPLFIHSALSILPIAIISIAYTLVNLFDKPGRSWILSLYLVFNLLLVLMALPLLINYPIPIDTYNRYLGWLNSILSSVGVK